MLTVGFRNPLTWHLMPRSNGHLSVAGFSVGSLESNQHQSPYSLNPEVRGVSHLRHADTRLICIRRASALRQENPYKSREAREKVGTRNPAKSFKTG